MIAMVMNNDSEHNDYINGTGIKRGRPHSLEIFFVVLRFKQLLAQI